MPRSPMTDLNPVAILRDAVKAVPAVKYALGIAGIVSVIAIVGALGVDLRVAAFGTVVMLVLMVVLVLFARLTTVISSPIFHGPVVAFLWFSMLLVAATAAVLFTSVFFQWPIDLRHWIRSVQEQNNIPDSVTTSLPTGLSVRDAMDYIAGLDGHVAVIANCSEPFINSPVQAGVLTGKTPKELLETLQHRITEPQHLQSYHVERVRDKGRYEITCEN